MLQEDFMWKEFKEFIMKGNVVDLAVGIIIGGAFGGIVSSLVNDIIMPPIGLLLGKINFADMYINLSDTAYPTLKAAKEASAATINYGLFINTLINFLIVALVLFLVIKAMNAMRKPAPAAAPSTKECPYCLTKVPLKATRCPACTSELKK
jgi:large conductance mechanosensitive channel